MEFLLQIALVFFLLHHLQIHMNNFGIIDDAAYMHTGRFETRRALDYVVKWLKGRKRKTKK